jgi:hypothetical protein
MKYNFKPIILVHKTIPNNTFELYLSPGRDKKKRNCTIVDINYGIPGCKQFKQRIIPEDNKSDPWYLRNYIRGQLYWAIARLDYARAPNDEYALLNSVAEGIRPNFIPSPDDPSAVVAKTTNTDDMPSLTLLLTVGTKQQHVRKRSRIII